MFAYLAVKKFYCQLVDNKMNKPEFFHILFCSIFVFFQPAESQNNETNRTNVGKSIFEINSIVPHILPSVPEEICEVKYNSDLTIVPGQSYFPRQLQGLPKIYWMFHSKKFYTLVVLGAFEKDSKTTQNITDKVQSNEIIPFENSWYQWVVVNVRKNNLNSGITLQPFEINFKPNGTRKIIYTFAVYEHKQKFDLNLKCKDNTSQKLLQLYFTPMSNFTQNFGGSSLLAGNFFYIIPEQGGVIQDSTSVPITFDLKRELLSTMKLDD